MPLFNCLLICTLISENQGLEKSRSSSNLRKSSGSTNLSFFLGLHLEKKLDLYYEHWDNIHTKLFDHGHYCTLDTLKKSPSDVTIDKSYIPTKSQTLLRTVSGHQPVCPGDKQKKSHYAGPEIFLRFETDLKFSRPWFSKIKVQIKRPQVGSLASRMPKCFSTRPRSSTASWWSFIAFFYRFILQCHVRVGAQTPDAIMSDFFWECSSYLLWHRMAISWEYLGCSSEHGERV